MNIRAFSKARALRAVCALTALAAASGAHAQALTVTAANASNDSVYNVNFNDATGGGTVSVLNNDGSSLHSLQSLTFATNPVNQQLDLLAADNQGGLIVRYFGDFQQGASRTGTLVWSFAPTAGLPGGGPSHPDGLSVDAFGNLFVVNVASGTSTQAQVWELVFDLTGQNPPYANLIDQSSSSFGSKTTLAETAVATTTIAGTLVGCAPPCTPVFTINPGDLLVLKSDPSGSAVLDYPGQNGAGPSSGPSSNPAGPAPTTLITLPTGVQPGGMAFWQTPSGTNLLVTTGTGVVLQYSLAQYSAVTNQPLQLANFTSNLGNGQYKVKTGTGLAGGVQTSNPYVFIADNNNGRIMQFDASGNLKATVTTGVQHPQGVAVTNAGYQALANCGVQQPNQPPTPCDVLKGNVLTHSINTNKNNLPGNILEDVCVVLNDPRATGPGTCQNADLDVSTVCGGAFSASADKPLHVKISAAHCGASGPTGRGFAMVRSDTQADSGALNGLLVESVANALNILPGPYSPACQAAPNTVPQAVALWASKAGEAGTPAEGPYMMDATNGCSSGHIVSNGGSLWAVGLELNQNSSGLPGNSITGSGGVVDTEYGNLLSTISAEVADGSLAPPTQPPQTGPWPPPANQNFNFTYTLQQCINTSRGASDVGGNANYLGAAADLLTADQSIMSNFASPNSAFTGPTANEPNAAGALEQRVEHLFYENETRLGGVNYGHTPPLPPAAPYLPTSPSFLTNPPKTIMVSAGSAFSFSATATNFAGSSANLTYSIVGLPAWAQFGPYTGTVSAVAGAAQKGSYPIQITATDGCAPPSKPWTTTIKVTG
jgi:hypothetical protein